MKKSLILSNLRIELRRKLAGYQTEKTTLKWVEDFFDQMSIVHSSQIRTWQRDAFLSGLKNNDNITYEDQLKARSSLMFLYERVLKRNPGFSSEIKQHAADNEPGVFKITG